MTVTSSTLVRQSGPGTASVPRPLDRRPRRRPGWPLLVQVLAAWAVSYLAYGVHAAVVLPLIILVGTASLLRGGQSLLDRLMLALAVLLGATCAAGMLFTVWPLGLHPIPVAGTALTALAGIAAATGRRPNLPRPRLRDAISVGPALALGAMMAWPLLSGRPVDRLGMAIAGEDLSRHIAEFDAIRRVGGYLFMHGGAATDYVYRGMVTYPQGSHLLTALLDGFLRSSPDTHRTALDATDHYLGFLVVSYALFALATAWAAQWIAGGGLTIGRRIVLGAFVFSTVSAGELFSVVPNGYPSEIVGLTEMVLLIAVLARPTPRMRQQLATIASLLVAVGFSYYLFLPAAAVGVLLWLVRNGARVRRRRIALATTIAASAVAGIPLLFGLAWGNQSAALIAKGAVRPSQDYLLALGCLVAVGLLAQRARGSRIWRSYAWSLLPVIALTISLKTIYLFASSGISYYMNKSVHLVIAALVVGAGSLALHLPQPQRAHRSTRQWGFSVVPATLLAVAIAAAFGMVRGDSPYRPVHNSIWARVWFNRSLSDTKGAAALLNILQYQTAPPTPTIVLADEPYETWSKTLFLSMLERTAGPIARGLYNGMPLGSPGVLDAMVTGIGQPMLIVTTSTQTYMMAINVHNQHPELSITVLPPQN